MSACSIYYSVLFFRVWLVSSILERIFLYIATIWNIAPPSALKTLVLRNYLGSSRGQRELL